MFSHLGWWFCCRKPITQCVLNAILKLKYQTEKQCQINICETCIFSGRIPKTWLKLNSFLSSADPTPTDMLLRQLGLQCVINNKISWTNFIMSQTDSSVGQGQEGHVKFKC